MNGEIEYEGSMYDYQRLNMEYLQATNRVCIEVVVGTLSKLMGMSTE